jgi:hypothetical protein
MQNGIRGSALAILLLSTPVLAQGEMPAAAPGAELDSLGPPPPVPASIEWRVERRFRLWSDGSPAAVEAAERLYEELRTTDDADSVHDRIVAFLSANPALHKAARWDPVAGSYLKTYLFPGSYVVRLRLADGGAPPNAQCQWRASAGRLVGSGLELCSASVQLVLPSGADRSGSVSAAVEVSVVGAAAIANTTVEVRDRLIVSLGDSFASGEGNPDVPANLGMLAGGPGSAWSEKWRQRWLARPAMAGVRSAAWLDRPCHRSFYNQHLVAALKHAADRPHEAVTFASYACTGAAIFNGLLVPQPSPVGLMDAPQLKAAPLAQVEALARDLCLPAQDGGNGWRLNARTYANTFGGTAERPIRKPALAKVVTCDTALGRGTDAILLSIGGNDASFAGIIMWALLPKRMDGLLSGPALKVMRAALAVDPADVGPAIRVGLPANLPLLDARLRQVAPGAKVYQSAYPAPIYKDDGGLCGPEDEARPDSGSDPVLKRLHAMTGLWPQTRLLPDTGWTMSIDRIESGITEAQVINPLNRTLSAAAVRSGWHFVGDFMGAIRAHGWCAGGAGEDSDLPDWNPGASAWEPWRPDAWTAYARRSRYFRTPNDAALTLAVESPRLPAWLRWPLNRAFDLHHSALLASLSGTFHPTFQAHTVMGLSLARALERDFGAAGGP